MKFPEKPTCHEGAWPAPSAEQSWRQYAGESFRRCSYCGSIHPEDLIKLVGEGAEIQGADWKYGWPHKFYVKGADGVGGAGKWYNEHITDEGFDDEARGALLGILESSGITFKIDSHGRLSYEAPHHGFQK
jgi:hypothetical protein